MGRTNTNKTDILKLQRTYPNVKAKICKFSRTQKYYFIFIFIYFLLFLFFCYFYFLFLLFFNLFLFFYFYFLFLCYISKVFLK